MRATFAREKFCFYRRNGDEVAAPAVGGGGLHYCWILSCRSLRAARTFRMIDRGREVDWLITRRDCEATRRESIAAIAFLIAFPLAHQFIRTPSRRGWLRLVLWLCRYVRRACRYRLNRLFLFFSCCARLIYNTCMFAGRSNNAAIIFYIILMILLHNARGTKASLDGNLEHFHRANLSLLYLNTTFWYKTYIITTSSVEFLKFKK